MHPAGFIMEGANKSMTSFSESDSFSWIVDSELGGIIENKSRLLETQFIQELEEGLESHLNSFF